MCECASEKCEWSSEPDFGFSHQSSNLIYAIIKKREMVIVRFLVDAVMLTFYLFYEKLTNKTQASGPLSWWGNREVE